MKTVAKLNNFMWLHGQDLLRFMIMHKYVGPNNK